MSSLFSFARFAVSVVLAAGVLISCRPDAGAGQGITPAGENSIMIGSREFRADYAITAEEKAQGLMFVESLPDDYAMVFVNERPAVTQFWMKNTLIPLDMLFFDAHGRLVHVEREATPHDLSARGPDVPICAAVEMQGGGAAAYGLRLGDKIIADPVEPCLRRASD